MDLRTTRTLVLGSGLTVSNQTLTGHLGAKTIIAELIGTYGREVVDTIRAVYPGLGSIVDEIETRLT